MHYYDIIRPERISSEVFDYLLARGWYPMRQMIFTTSHIETPEGYAHRVHWLRYQVSAVVERKSHRRIRRNARALSVEYVEPFEHREELNDLYDRYLSWVEFDPYPSIGAATADPGEESIYDSSAIIVRDRGRAVACGIYYSGLTSVASIVHFYDPEYARLSLGKYLILLTLEQCARRGIEWYYPGYIIEGDKRMDYKLFVGPELAEYYSPVPHPMRGQWLRYEAEPRD